jgi:tRNA-Thr(GGU) m(6)t(6)A37 methyltransferase TsaA
VILENVSLNPIGVVRNEIIDRKDMPTFGVESSIDLFPDYTDGLLSLEKHSHLWVLTWLHTATRDALQVVPRGLKNRGSEGLHGVFALRSPTRPNPIGLTVARILDIHPNSIRLHRLDFIDGTPVVDLKPYFVTRDLVYSATNAQAARPASREAILEALLCQAEQFCGEITPDIELAAGALAHFRAEVLEFLDPSHWRITVPESRPALADAAMAMTRVRLGNATLRFHDRNSLIVEAGGKTREFPI